MDLTVSAVQDIAAAVAIAAKKTDMIRCTANIRHRRRFMVSSPLRGGKLPMRGNPRCISGGI